MIDLGLVRFRSFFSRFTVERVNMTPRSARAPGERGPKSGSFGDFLSSKRIGLDKKQSECAGEVGVTGSIWSAWERDRVRPSPDKLEKIAEAMGCSVATLKRKLSLPREPRPRKFRRGQASSNGHFKPGDLTPALVRQIADNAEKLGLAVITADHWEHLLALTTQN